MPGRTLTLIGADGAGKSTLAAQLRAHSDLPTVFIYMGANPSAITHALPTTRAWMALKRALGWDAHRSGPPDNAATVRPSSPVERTLRHFKSLAALVYRVSEDSYRLLVGEVYRRRGYLVIMDRHPYPDYYARRVRGVQGEWLRWGDRVHGFLLRHVYPHPRDLILLDAPAEVLHARKPEGTIEAVRSRRCEYLDMIGHLPDVAVIDVDRPQREVLADVLALARDGAAPLADHALALKARANAPLAKRPT